MKSRFLHSAPQAVSKGRKRVVRTFTTRQGVLLLTVLATLIFLFLVLFWKGILRVD